MTWTWQDEAWRFNSTMSNMTWSPARLVQLQIARHEDEFPPEDESGGAGVREPRRPRPNAPAGSAALVLV